MDNKNLFNDDSCSEEEEPKQIFEFNEANVQKLKDKYSRELKDRPDNPIKVCMGLIFQAAIEKNSEKRLELSLELSNFLTKPDGVINLFLALVDFDTSSQRVTTHNQRFIAVANIITQLPKLCMSYESFCHSIVAQLRPLLISDNTRYSSLACIIIQAIINSPHAKRVGKEKITEIILNPLFDALHLPEQPIKPRQAVIAVHNLIHNHIPTKLFVKLIPNLFYALVTLCDTPSRLKLLLRASIISILNGLSPGAACCSIEEALFFSDKVKCLYSTNAEEDEISIRVLDSVSNAEKPLEDDNSEKIEKLVISLLESCNNELFVLEFFFHFQEVMWTAKDEECRQLSASIIEPLLKQTIQEEETKLDLLSIIAKNSSRSLDLISRTLLNYVAFLRDEQEQENSARRKFISSSIGSCFSILEVLAVTLQQSDERNIQIRNKCLPVLKQIQKLLETKCKPQEMKGERTNLSSLIDRFEKDTNYAGKRLNQGKCDSSTEFDIILKDLNDRLVPVRVHALVRLKQMILANEEYTVSRIEQLYNVIEAFLADQEPYVFLACINLMAEMAIRRTSEILPKLIGLHSKQSLDLQHRINVGEVLIRLTKQMNATTPFYAQQVMNMLFNGCRDNEELMRMSSLTNIGEIFHNLGDSLGKYMIDILNTIETIIESDTIPVKCAAIDLLRTTLSGLDKFTIESIQRELKSIYNLLKKVKIRTLDEELCLQVDLALEEVGRLARDILGVNIDVANDKLVKNIKFLSLVER